MENSQEEILLGTARPFKLRKVATPGGLEYHLISPWDTLIRAWDEEPEMPIVKRKAIFWSATHPEENRPEVPHELPKSFIHRVRNKVASLLWVK